MWNRFKTLDPWLYILPIFLSGCGIAGIYSITYLEKTSSFLPDMVIKQMIFTVLGIILMLIMTFIDYRSLKGWGLIIYIFSLLVLILLALLPESSVFVVKDFGAKRWLGFKGIQFQPSELIKVAIIILLARIFANIHGQLRWKNLITASVVIFIPLAIVIKQPDLGTAIIICLSSLIILCFANLTKTQWLTLIIFLVVIFSSFGLSYYKIQPFDILLKDYQKDRIATFIDPEKVPVRSGYNILQSVIAVGSGGVLGKGLGWGSQSQLYFLPVAHADFIFAALSESWGFIGSTLIIIIYGILLLRIINSINIAKDKFGMILATGIFGIIIFQVLINIGMNIKLFPVTGIPLPLLSYGGTSVLSTYFIIGIAQSIVMRYKKINF